MHGAQQTSNFPAHKSTGVRRREDYTWVAILLGVMLGSIIGTLYVPLLGTLVGGAVSGFIFWANYTVLWSVFVEKKYT